MTDQPTNPEYLIIGQVTRPHGVRGELKLRIMTDYPERVGSLETVYVASSTDGKGAKPYSVRGMRMNKGNGLLRLDEITDRDAADRLRQQYILVSLQDAIPLDEDEFYLFQVIGMTVQLADGTVLGTVRDIIETGANDVYIVDSPEHGEVLFPITPETLIDHDTDARIVHVNLIDGLL